MLELHGAMIATADEDPKAMPIHRDPETSDHEPLSATGLERIGDLTWEFRRREGVSFHDGSPFDADDMAGR